MYKAFVKTQEDIHLLLGQSTRAINLYSGYREPWLLQLVQSNPVQSSALYIVAILPVNCKFPSFLNKPILVQRKNEKLILVRAQP